MNQLNRRKSVRAWIFLVAISPVVLVSFQNCGPNGLKANLEEGSSLSGSLIDPHETPPSGDPSIEGPASGPFFPAPNTNSNSDGPSSKASLYNYKGGGGTEWTYQVDEGKLAVDVRYDNKALIEKSHQFPRIDGLSENPESDHQCRVSVAPGGASDQAYETHLLTCYVPILRSFFFFHRVHYPSTNTWSALVPHPVMSLNGIQRSPNYVTSIDSKNGSWLHAIGHHKVQGQKRMWTLSQRWSERGGIQVFFKGGIEVGQKYQPRLISGLRDVEATLINFEVQGVEASQSNIRQDSVSFTHKFSDVFNRTPLRQGQVLTLFQHFDSQNRSNAVFHFSPRPNYKCEILGFFDEESLGENWSKKFDGRKHQLKFRLKSSAAIPHGAQVKIMPAFFFHDGLSPENYSYHNQPNLVVSEKFDFLKPIEKAFEIERVGYYNLIFNVVAQSEDGEIQICRAQNLLRYER